MIRQCFRGADSRGRVAQVVEEDVQAGLEPRRAGLRVVHQELRDVIDGLRRGPRAEDLMPWVRLDLGELELCVVRIHGHKLVPRWRPKHLDDLHKLVHAGFSWEDGLAEHQLRGDACGGPDIDHRRVVGGPEYELGCTVVTRAYV